MLNQKALTLVEVIVSVILGMIIIAALVLGIDLTYSTYKKLQGDVSKNQSMVEVTEHLTRKIQDSSYAKIVSATQLELYDTQNILIGTYNLSNNTLTFTTQGAASTEIARNISLEFSQLAGISDKATEVRTSITQPFTTNIILTSARTHPPKTWARTFGGTGNDYAFSVDQTSDGGYIISGSTMSFTLGDEDLYMIITDPNGNQLGYNAFSSGGEGRCVQQTSDGGYVVTGTLMNYNARPPNYDFWLKKIGSSGQSSFFKFLGQSSADYAYSVQQTSDGGYIIAGATRTVGAASHDVYIIKTDSRGRHVWDKKCGGSDDDYAYSVKQTSDDGYIIAGYTLSFGKGAHDFYLIKRDSNGYPSWEKTFGGSSSEYAYSVQQTSDDGYIIAGHTYSFGPGNNYDVYLIKTDSSGTTAGNWDSTTKAWTDNQPNQWQWTFGGAADNYAYSVQQTSDGGYIIAGATMPVGAASHDVYIIKTDSRGRHVWDKTFGGTDDDVSWSVQQTSDGGYIIAGKTNSFGVGGYDVYLIKTDASGNCPEAANPTKGD